MSKADPRTVERRERFREYCRLRGWFSEDINRWNVSAIALATGKPTQKASDLLNGHGSFGAKIAREIEEKLELPDGYFDGLGSDDEFALVPRVDVMVSAGHGSLVYEEGQKSALSFRRSFLRDIGASAASAVVLTVKGHSMEPTIRDASVLLISTSAKTVLDREIYALRVDGELFVKRMVNAGGNWLATSDNPDQATYPPIPISGRELDVEIVGRALWMGTRL